MANSDKQFVAEDEKAFTRALQSVGQIVLEFGKKFTAAGSDQEKQEAFRFANSEVLKLFNDMETSVPNSALLGAQENDQWTKAKAQSCIAALDSIIKYRTEFLKIGESIGIPSSEMCPSPMAYASMQRLAMTVYPVQATFLKNQFVGLSLPTDGFDEVAANKSTILETPADNRQVESPSDVLSKGRGERRITLCLSGGGFRATIFHLGLVDYLVQTGLVREVGSIYGVSGGSITAAYLLANWSRVIDKGHFPKVAQQLMEFCCRGVISEVVIGSTWSGKDRTKVLAGILEKTILTNFSVPENAPRVYAVFSSVNDFHHFALELNSKELLEYNPANSTKLSSLGPSNITPATGVACSACFPLAFEPHELTTADGLPTKVTKNRLVADGGIIDNFGILAAHEREVSLSSDHRVYVVSDAAQYFDDVSRERQDLAPVSSAPFRTIDFLMNAVGEANLRLVTGALVKSAAPEPLVVRLARVAEPGVAGVPANAKLSIASIRTGLNSFSADEIIALYRAGICVAMDQLASLAGSTSNAVTATGLLSVDSDNRPPMELKGTPFNKPWIRFSLRGPGVDATDRILESLLRSPARWLVGAIVLLALAGVGCLVFGLWLIEFCTHKLIFRDRRGGSNSITSRTEPTRGLTTEPYDP